MKKSYKKAVALYLPVALFFVFFSLGISTAHADVANPECDTSGPPDSFNNQFVRNCFTSPASSFSLYAVGVVTGDDVTPSYSSPNTYCVSNGEGDIYGMVDVDTSGWIARTSYIIEFDSPLTIPGDASIPGNGWLNLGFAPSSGNCYAPNGAGLQAAGVSGTVATYLYTAPLTPDDTTTRFTSFVVNPTTGYVTMTGYWTASATSTQSQELRFWQFSPNLGQEAYQSRIATTSGAFSFSFPYLDTSFQISATSSSYSLGTDTTFHAQIFQLYSGFNPFSNTGTPPILLTSTSTRVSATTTATVVSNNPRSLSELPEPEDCSLGNLTGCLKNAGIWLLYPSSDSIDSFKGLAETLSGKFPFAYAYGMNTMRMELFDAVQTSTTSISLTFKIIPGHGTSTLELLSSAKLEAVPYSGTVKIILGWILWLLAIEYIYYRVLRSHDSSTPS